MSQTTEDAGFDDRPAPPKDATPRIKAPKLPKPQQLAPTVHVRHDNDRRRQRHYVADCPACRLDDLKRRDMSQPPQVGAEDLYRTIFLIPDYAPEHRIAELYLQQRYPGAVNIGSSLNYNLVPQMPEIQVVVVCRRPVPGHEITPHVRKVLQADNKWIEESVPLTELVPEVLESAPIVVGDAVEVSAQSLVSASQVNTDELVERLAEVAPGYRIFRQNPPDQLIVLQAE
jgi:hypothetical protein